MLPWRMRRALVGAALALASSGAPAAVPAALPPAQSLYLEGCGGCHGVQGRSLGERVPDLAGQVGYFLCTPQGREYLVRLPNVAFAAMGSDQLAQVMNLVVFGLGASTAPAGASPYTGAEVAMLRRRPLDTVSLARLRARIAGDLPQHCPGARALHAYGGP